MGFFGLVCWAMAEVLQASFLQDRTENEWQLFMSKKQFGLCLVVQHACKAKRMPEDPCEVGGFNPRCSSTVCAFVLTLRNRMSKEGTHGKVARDTWHGERPQRSAAGDTLFHSLPRRLPMDLSAIDGDRWEPPGFCEESLCPVHPLGWGLRARFGSRSFGSRWFGEE